MTAAADHMRGLWGYSDPLFGSFNITGQQKALRLGRQFPGYTLQVPGFFGGGSVVVRPYVFPLPAAWTGDQWGVPFDSANDVVVLVIDQGLLSPLTLPYNEAFEEKWYDNLINGATSMFMLPAALPGGYTASPQVLWRSDSLFEFGLSGWNPKYYTPSGFKIVGPLTTPYPWGPYPLPWGETDGSGTWEGFSVSLGTPFTGPAVYWTYHNGLGDGSVGFRKIQYRVASDGSPTYALTNASSGNLTITFSHNADGSDPGSADGDTTDYTASFDTATLVQDPDTIWRSGWIDAGPALAALGTPSIMKASMSSAGIGPITPYNGYVRFHLEMNLSPRFDIPWPTTVLGQGNVIAPGGYL